MKLPHGLLAIGWLIAAHALALGQGTVDVELERLPPVEPYVTPAPWQPIFALGSAPRAAPQQLQENPVRPAGYPMTLSQPAVPQDVPSAADAAPPGTKSGAFQKLAATLTNMPGGGTDGLGETDFEVWSVFALPAPTRESPLVLTPDFQVHYFDGPESPDLPPRLYDLYMQIRWICKLSPAWGMDVAIEPGWHTDFQQDDAQAFRIPARALVVYDWLPNAQIVLGWAYLAREDVTSLPVVGLIWTPNEDTKFELVVPRPKFARRYFCEGNVERWWYLVGEFGGGSYAIERASGAQDVVTLSDLRFLAGIERKALGGINYWIEAGYVFDRKVEYASGTPEFNPSDTGLVRLGMSY